MYYEFNWKWALVIFMTFCVLAKGMEMYIDSFTTSKYKHCIANLAIKDKRMCNFQP
jgi:hypothetical protein